MTKTTALLTAALAGAAAIACSDTSREVAGDAAASDAATGRGVVASDMALQSVQERRQAGAPEPTPGTPASTALGTRVVDTSVTMIIRTGSANVRVDDVQRAVAAVRELAVRLGGYVANTSYQGGRDQVRSATLELKIPAGNYEQALAGLPRVGEVESVNTVAEDVGEEYVDLAARVANSRRLETRLIELLATRTGRLQDVLAVERELARVREEIERFEGRMRYLRTRAAMSTLTVTVHEPEPLHGFSPGDNPIVTGFKRAWRNFVGFLSAVIAAMGVIVPLAALGWVAWRLYPRVRARLRPRRES